MFFSASAIMYWATEPCLADSFEGTPVKVSYYTDPLCPWSWAMEPVIYKFLQAYGQRVQLNFRMAGLMSSSYNVEGIYAAPSIQQVCDRVSCETGMQISDKTWEKNHPVTPFAACTAFKYASRQSHKAGALFLSLLRMAAMGKGKDINNRTVLLSLAQTVSEFCADFDVDVFLNDLDNGDGSLELREDFLDAFANGIEGMPCLVFERNGKTMRLNGYQTMEQLAAVMTELLALPEEKELVKKNIPARSVYLSYK